MSVPFVASQVRNLTVRNAWYTHLLDLLSCQFIMQVNLLQLRLLPLIHEPLETWSALGGSLHP